MLVIQKSQMAVFGEAAVRQFEAERQQHVARHFPGLCGYVGDAAVHRAVACGVAAARRHGMRGRVEAGLYLDLTFLLGAHFDTDAQIPWAAEWLAPEAAQQPLRRVRRLYDRAMAFLDESHGAENQHLVRGLLRIRALRPGDFPPDGEGLSEWLGWLLPQKAAATGPGPMSDLAAGAAAMAARHGLAAPGDAAVLALHMFMFGSGFDRDPLVPWAAPILAPGGTNPGEDRTGRLFAASLRYADAVLG